jgi:pyrimidine operon attenuation protein / uracil phosphoribosyltransferase
MSGLMLDAEALYADLLRGLQQMLAAYDSPVSAHLVGVASGGVWLAERARQDLQLSGEVGVLSSSMHRDDFAQRGLASSAQTRLPFDVNGAHLIVLDDVLYTGRTVRAVLNELFDYGRPASVKLAVLVDRGGRELPVQADLAVARVSLPPGQSLQLERDAAGRFRLDVQGG